jgi:hypothetical protein
VNDCGEDDASSKTAIQSLNLPICNIKLPLNGST